MKKVLPLMVIGIFVLSGLEAVALPLGENKADTYCLEKEINTIGDELDQYQATTPNAALPVGRLAVNESIIFNVSVAQSFIPQKEMLTRVELYIGRNETTTYSYVVAIRKHLTEENLAITSVSADKIPVVENITDFEWIEFDFADLLVTINQTYYIVAYTANASENFYYWAANNNSESYPHGCAWISLDGGDTWTNESTAAEYKENWINGYSPLNYKDNTWDMNFKTYGREAYNLETQIKGGIGVNLVIKNTGPGDAEDIDYNITVTGGLLGMINVSVGDTIEMIEADQQTKKGTGLFLGLGPIEIKATADIDEITAKGFVILFFVLITS